jgi:hypothetical protein
VRGERDDLMLLVEEEGAVTTEWSSLGKAQGGGHMEEEGVSENHGWELLP